MEKAGRPVSFAPLFYRKVVGMAGNSSSPIFLWKMGEENGEGWYSSKAFIISLFQFCVIRDLSVKSVFAFYLNG